MYFNPPKSITEYINGCTLQLEESNVLLTSFSLEPYDFGQRQEVYSVKFSHPSALISSCESHRYTASLKDKCKHDEKAEQWNPLPHGRNLKWVSILRYGDLKHGWMKFTTWKGVQGTHRRKMPHFLGSWSGRGALQFHFCNFSKSETIFWTTTIRIYGTGLSWIHMIASFSVRKFKCFSFIAIANYDDTFAFLQPLPSKVSGSFIKTHERSPSIVIERGIIHITEELTKACITGLWPYLFSRTHLISRFSG